jgi:hypothetical protein
MAGPFTLFKNSLGRVIVDSIYSEITNKRSRYYHWIGKENPWTDFLSPFIPSSDSDIPGPPQDNFRYDLHVLRDMLSFKYITPSDISHVIRRIDWVSGEVYDMYDYAYTPAIESAVEWFANMEVSVPSETVDPNKVYVGDIVKFNGSGTDGNTYYYIVRSAGNVGTIPPTHTDGNITYGGVIFGYYTRDFIAFSGATSLKDSNFYVLTDDFNVYKCIWNNNDGISTVKPTGTDIDNLVTTDGYIWKFLYRIPTVVKNKFLTAEYMPVTNSITSQFYSGGSITEITIEHVGFEYTNPVTIIDGDGVGADVTANVVSNEIRSFTINESGGEYTFASAESYEAVDVGDLYTVVDAGDFVTGQTYRINSVGTTNFTNIGATTNTVGTLFVATGAGSGSGDAIASDYSVYFVGTTNFTSLGATAVDADEIEVGTEYIITSLGDTDFTDVGATELTAGSFVINESYIITSAGNTNFTLIGAANNTVGTEFIATGVGAGTGTAIKTRFKATAVGTGTGTTLKRKFTLASGVSLSGTGIAFKNLPFPATLIPNLSIGDVNTQQANVQLTARPGSIETFKIVDGGSGYTTPPTISVLGDGVGSPIMTPIIDQGKISQVLVSQPSETSGYTWTEVSVSGGGGTGARIRAINSPIYGHGHNSIEELNCDSIMLYTSFFRDKNQGMIITNDYRKAGLIRNLREFTGLSGGRGRLFEGTFGSGCVKVKGNFDTAQLEPDMLLYKKELSGAEPYKKYRIIEISDTEVLLSVFNNFTLNVGDVLITDPRPEDGVNPVSDYQFTISEVSERTVDQFSGDFLMLSVRESFESDELGNIKLRTIITA